MSNELNNIIARNTDGVYEGVAIGGDRYPGTSFMDHLLRYQVSIHFLLKAVPCLSISPQATQLTSNSDILRKLGFSNFLSG